MILIDTSVWIAHFKRANAWLAESLGIRKASGTVLDHLYVIDAAAARARLTS